MKGKKMILVTLVVLGILAVVCPRDWMLGELFELFGILSISLMCVLLVYYLTFAPKKEIRGNIKFVVMVIFLITIWLCMPEEQQLLKKVHTILLVSMLGIVNSLFYSLIWQRG